MQITNILKMQPCASLLRLPPRSTTVIGRRFGGHYFSLSPNIHPKLISTRSITAESAQDRLAAQRRNRPVAPAMTIYKWQYVSSVSAAQRITGLLLSGSLYGFATLYLLTPVTGLYLDSDTIVAAFASLPLAAKAAIKFGLSVPFTYHGFNGIKHLVWDSGRLLGKKSSGRASWVVLGCSLGSSLALALIQF